MARPIDECAVAWHSLSGTSDEPGWRTIPVTPAGRCQLSAGRRFPGNQEALLASFPGASLPAAEKLPDGQGFSVERVDPHGDGSTWIALARAPSGGSELFATMVADVAGALDAEAGADGARLLRVFIGRVRAWQEFMRKGAQSLGPEEEIGLVGELIALSSIIGAGLPAAIACEAWLGPVDGLRDFEVGTGGIEVKCALSAVGFPARIGSLDQLDDTARQPLFVAGVRLRQVESGQSLPDFVETLRDVVRGDEEAERALAERLVAAGYFDAHASGYARRFAHVASRIVEVGPTFPRLTPSRVPAGIVRASYEIDLDRAPGPNVGMDEALRKLGAL